MPVERTADRTSFLDALDRVLDKGIVIDAWMRASLGGVGIDLITVETSVIVASIATYLRTSAAGVPLTPCGRAAARSEEHTSELQSHHDLVCRLLLEKKNNHKKHHN